MSTEPMNLEVDDDGFVCVVAPDSYEGFVDEDWTLDRLLARFVEQMNRGSLFVVYPGPDCANSEILFGTEQTPTNAGREASGIVEVGAAGLWLTDYAELTMAAQFSDESPIASYSHHLPVTAGRYRITIREHAAQDEPTFVLTVSPASADTVVQQVSVPWFEVEILQ